MIKIKIIAQAKLKEKYLREASQEYEKRLLRYCNINITELQPAFLPENPSQAQISVALSHEAESINRQLGENAYNIALCVEGKEMSSEDLAQVLRQKVSMGTPINFIIGSSYGLHESIKQSADLRLSVSRMTFPHQLFRVMLLEQIYRAFKINEGSTYHK